MYQISTWRDMQAPLLSAVETETNILNVLLFLIIAVAGFGILAIFYMIVVEKTRDIGTCPLRARSARGTLRARRLQLPPDHPVWTMCPLLRIRCSPK